MQGECHQPLEVMLGEFIRLRRLDVLDVSPDSFAGLAKEITLLVCVLRLLGYQKHGSPDDPLGSESYVVSPHFVSSFVDNVVMPMNY
jgi:hypothetical protein